MVGVVDDRSGDEFGAWPGRGEDESSASEGPWGRGRRRSGPVTGVLAPLVAALAMGWLLELATRYGAGMAALALLVIYLVAFVASGAPMLWGDLHRSYRTRTMTAALAAAERAMEE